jgi:hypothetical protein
MVTAPSAPAVVAAGVADDVGRAALAIADEVALGLGVGVGVATAGDSNRGRLR